MSGGTGSGSGSGPVLWHKVAVSPEDYRALLDHLSDLGHRMNNPLTTMLGRSQILRMKSGADPAVDSAAAAIEESGRQLAAYIQQLGGLIQTERGRLYDPNGVEEAAVPSEADRAEAELINS